MVSQRTGRCRDGSRLHKVGRPAHIVDALRRICCARLQDRHDAASRAGRAGCGQRTSGETGRGSLPIACSAAHAGFTACGRPRRGGRTGEAFGRCGKSGHFRRRRHTHSGGNETARRIGGDVASACRGREVPIASPSQPSGRRTAP